jgi:thiol-disulfide isomerase/thioredoxin
MSHRMAPACRGLGFWTYVRNAALLPCAAVLCLTLPSLSHAVELKSRTGAAPSFELRTLDGSEINLDALRGKIVVVHFFATWCEPCRAELPALQRFALRASGQHVAVVAISVAEVELRVRRFFQSIPVGFPVLLDRDGAVGKAWEIQELPSTVILDSDLRPRLAVEGDFLWDQLDPQTLVGRLAPGDTVPDARLISSRGHRT